MKLIRIAQVTFVAAIVVAAQSMKDDPGARLRMIQDAYAYAVFPSAARASAVLGVTYGTGEVFEQGRVIGYAGVVQITGGVQLGGEVLDMLVIMDDHDALDRFNRSFEYDGLGDGYVRFLLEELLPEVEKKTAADGRPIKLSKNGNDRCIGGASSGAICAFTAAWERPDAFRRVFSSIGTYVGLRGGSGHDLAPIAP